MIEIERAPAFATVQDGGRDGYRRSGVPPGGAIDRLSLQLGNALLGNSLGAPAIEWALTGGAVRFGRTTAVALTGASAAARLDGAIVRAGEVHVAREGGSLEIDQLTTGRFAYVCVRGGVDVPTVLGGRGTYLPAGFGGHEGRRLAKGDRLRVAEHRGVPAAAPAVERALQVLDDRTPLRVVPGPQVALLGHAGLRTLLDSEVTIAADSDRAGYRLLSTQSTPYRADGRSEPACVGAIQLTPDGNLIVLMPDGPTVGGYPKIAVVATCDLPRLAQMVPGEQVRFRLSTREEATTALREQMAALHRILALTRPGGRP